MYKDGLRNTVFLVSRFVQPYLNFVITSDGSCAGVTECYQQCQYLTHSRPAQPTRPSLRLPTLSGSGPSFASALLLF